MEKFYELLGWEVRDRVSGFQGVVGTIGLDLYGCVQAIVDPPVTKDKDGKQVREHGHWFDVTRLDKVGTKRVMEPIPPRFVDPPGGYDKPVK